MPKPRYERSKEIEEICRQTIIEHWIENPYRSDIITTKEVCEKSGIDENVKIVGQVLADCDFLETIRTSSNNRYRIKENIISS